MPSSRRAPRLEPSFRPCRRRRSGRAIFWSRYAQPPSAAPICISSSGTPGPRAASGRRWYSATSFAVMWSPSVRRLDRVHDRRLCLSRDAYRLRPLLPLPHRAISISAAMFRSSAWIGRAASQNTCRYPEANAWINDAELDPAIAAAQEPFGNAVHTALRTDLATRRVLVTGCGPIGLFAVGIARAAGAARIFATDVNPGRLEMARAMGATRSARRARRRRRRRSCRLPMARASTCCWRCRATPRRSNRLRCPRLWWLRRAAGAAGTADRQLRPGKLHRVQGRDGLRRVGAQNVRDLVSDPRAAGRRQGRHQPDHHPSPAAGANSSRRLS